MGRGGENFMHLLYFGVECFSGGGIWNSGRRGGGKIPKEIAGITTGHLH